MSVQLDLMEKFHRLGEKKSDLFRACFRGKTKTVNYIQVGSQKSWFTIPNVTDLLDSLDHIASRPISRHIIVSAQSPQPTQPEMLDSANSSLTTGSQKLTNPPRHRYPPELLKHRFMPFGSLVQSSAGTEIAQDGDVMMEVDRNIRQTTTSEAGEKLSKKSKKDGTDEAILGGGKEKEKKSKSKKRKGEEVEDIIPSQKSKKVRTAG